MLIVGNHHLFADAAHRTFVAQRIAVLPLQNRYSGAILGQSTFKNPLLRPFTGLLFVDTKLTIFSEKNKLIQQILLECC